MRAQQGHAHSEQRGWGTPAGCCEGRVLSIGRRCAACGAMQARHHKPLERPVRVVQPSSVSCGSFWASSLSSSSHASSRTSFSRLSFSLDRLIPSSGRKSGGFSSPSSDSPVFWRTRAFFSRERVRLRDELVCSAPCSAPVGRLLLLLPLPAAAVDEVRSVTAERSTGAGNGRALEPDPPGRAESAFRHLVGEWLPEPDA